MALVSPRSWIAGLSTRFAQWLGEPALGNPSASAAEVAHLRKIFERSSKAARIGVWECALPSEALAWTDMVYELFDLLPGSTLDRPSIVDMYTEASRAELTRLRNRAIEERGGFSLDAEIITAKGNHRWIRITAIVECESDVPIRIFGLKQDITSEKIMIDQIRRLAETDALSGLANRNQFEKEFEHACALRSSGDQSVLFLVDMDGFKLVNDSFGHQAGDECLKETARRLMKILDQADVIARIGGDEFAILHRCSSLDGANRIGGEIIAALAQDYSRDGKQIRVGVSIGAVFGTSGFLPKDVFAVADKALYAAKREGGGILIAKEMDNSQRVRAA